MLVAAAYLSWTRNNVMQKEPEGSKNSIPTTLHGHPWFLYVDSGLSERHLNDLTELLNSEIMFILCLLQPTAKQVET